VVVVYGIRAVTFDLWGTLVQPRSYREFRLPLLRAFLQANGVELEEAKLVEVYQAGFSHSTEVHRATGRRHVDVNEIVNHTIELVGLGGKCDYGLIVKYYEEAVLNDPPKLNEGALETLESLSGRVKIGLISDSGTSPGRVMRRVLDDYDVLRYFDVTVFSDEVGFCKPNEIMFRAALDGLKAMPEETLHVGDLIKNDVLGAKRAGMRTAWLKTVDESYPSEAAPDFIIGGLLEVVAIVKDLSRL
jgi:putative hydrolase of the HAD superfamily